MKQAVYMHIMIILNDFENSFLKKWYEMKYWNGLTGIKNHYDILKTFLRMKMYYK